MSSNCIQLHAYLKPCNQLKTFYETTLDLTLPKNDQHFFPYINTYMDCMVNNFTYIAPLIIITNDFKKLLLLWKAQAADGCKLVVKFTQRYDHNAHILCAEAGLAPQLLYVDAQHGFIMILMEYVHRHPLSSYSPAEIQGLSLDSCHRILADITAAINVLHQTNTVFGNLHPLNILVVDNYNGTHGM